MTRDELLLDQKNLKPLMSKFLSAIRALCDLITFSGSAMDESNYRNVLTLYPIEAACVAGAHTVALSLHRGDWNRGVA